MTAIDPSSGAAQRIPLPRDSGVVVDICAVGEARQLVALVKQQERDFHIQEWTGARWVAGARLPIVQDLIREPYRSPPRLACDDKIYVMTPEQLVEIGGSRFRQLRLEPTIEPDFADYHLLLHADALWVGVDAGEWGGAIRRIDLATGQVQTIFKEVWPGICSGPLSKDCDAIFAMAPSPWNRDCIVVAAGSMPTIVKGRLLEVCGTRVTRLYFRRLDDDELWSMIKNDRMEGGEPALTVGYFGLAPGNGELLALGYDGIYRFQEPATPQISPLPKPENVGGFGVAEISPGVHLVQARKPDEWPGKGPVFDGSQFMLVSKD